MKWKNDRDRILLKHVNIHKGKKVKTIGRIFSIKKLGGISFINLIDRSGQCQLVLDPNLNPPSIQSIIECTGIVVEDEKAPNGHEIHVDEINTISSPTISLPLNPLKIPNPKKPGGPSLETLFNHRSLSLQNLFHQGILKISSETLNAIDIFLRKLDFIEIKTAKIVSGGTEGGSGLFEVKYFERLAFLAQSPQLYKQTLASTPAERVFEIGPAFRAEKHSTTSHINEFISIDVELSHPGNMDDLIDLEEDLIKSVISHIGANCSEEIKLLNVTLPKISKSIPRIELDEAKEILSGKKPSRTKPGEDLTPEEERDICDWASRKYSSEAIFIHSFPTNKRPFYTMPQDNRRKSKSFDLLLRGLEISSGSIRIHFTDLLERNLERQGINLEKMTSYLDIFRYGCPPHGGFGIGLERLVQKLIDLPNVRYASLFPRDRSRLEP